MSSFKRKSASKQQNLAAGTRLLSSTLSTVITSTGIPSLDDILGGGLPLSCSLAILAPDSHSAYGELVQKYFIAQGLACGQKLCVVDDDAESFVRECMWMPGSAGSGTPVSTLAADKEDERVNEDTDKVKIAWRYERMKKFQTTVSWQSSAAEDFCLPLDLTCRIPISVVAASQQTGLLTNLNIRQSGSREISTKGIISRLSGMLQPSDDGPSLPTQPVRICIPSLGGPQWGDINQSGILQFLHSLRTLLRQHPHACASVSLAPHICSDSWGGPGWTQKIGWLTDAAITLSAFTGDPSLSTLFPSHHGLLHIHTLPAPHTLLPPSDRFSTLRGLASSAVTIGGSGENNLAFKCTRRRLLFETLHLDVEGGVGERRTTPAANALTLDSVTMLDSTAQSRPSSGAALEVELETAEIRPVALDETVSVDSRSPTLSPKKKPKKKVVFQSDRPELYDF